MEIRRSESLHDLVHAVEHDIVHFGMIRTITFAIEAVRIGPDVIFGEFHPRLFIELRVDLQQFARLAMPRLMAQQIDQRHEPDALLTAQCGQPAGQRSVPAVGIGQFGTRFEIIGPVHPDDQRIDTRRSQIVLHKIEERIRLFYRGKSNRKSPNRKTVIEHRNINRNRIGRPGGGPLPVCSSRQDTARRQQNGQSMDRSHHS